MAAAALKKIFSMATITLMDLWQLLHPSETFDTRGRYERCFAVWNRWDEAKRTRIYQQIAAKLQNGEFINSASPQNGIL